MSSENNLDNGDKGTEGATTVVYPNDVDETPRVEIPVAVRVSTPSTVMAESHQEPNGVVDNGYFAARPAASELQRHPVFTSSPSTSPPTSPGTASLPERASRSEDALLQLPSRPTVHSTDSSLSIQSADSASTITAASSAPVLTPSGHQRPDFPNQAYSALHSQRHPTSRAIPPSLRQRGTHPGQIFTFASALASRHQPGARTIGSSAPVTPGVGLYTPQPAPTSSDWESLAAPGTYASPFLHFTQRSQPKETTVADVDVDPISGRKLINHYEIIDELGRGTHGKVKLGRDLKTDTHVAIKIVERFSKRRKLGRLGTTEDKVMKEVAILKQVRHPNVTALLEVIDDPTRKKVYIVLEWVELGQIQWRTKGPKEITMIEARRYERERSGNTNKQLEAEDEAIVKEAQKRLMRRRRRDLRTLRQLRQETPSEVWSVETAGDDESGTSDDDKLSRVSTESYSNMLLHSDGRRSSRTPSPLPPPMNDVDVTSRYLPLTSEPLSHSPLTLTNVYTGLEGTMYGAYTASVPSSADHSRGSSGNASDPLRRRAITSSESLARMASELLDRGIDDELENVPVLTIQQIRVAFRDTLLGLQYLHYQGIIHRDIKPPNLLETREHRVKISDFGVSYLGRPKGEDEDLEDVSEHEAQDLDDGAKELAKTVGTPAFYAPELCITEPVEDAPPITGAIDVWALGVTLFCMLFARTPFVDNEFIVMRQIAEEDVYLPRKRLKPIEPKSRSRPSSQRRVHQPTASERRHDLELAYEDISDDLYDLLKRMLVRDPRKRIKLDEIRHHPWVTADIHDKVKWLEETDPPRQNKGKKIQVTKEDVNAAVVPLQFLDRVRTTIKNFGERLGFTSKPASRGRTRSSVGGGIETSPSPSNASNSTNVSREVLRNNSRDEDTLRSPLRATYENGHPLSTSVNASPEQEAKNRGIKVTSVPEVPLAPSSLHPASELAGHFEAASGSMRTVQQSDFHVGHGDDSAPSSPGMTEASTSLESPVSDIVGAAGGRVRRMFRSVRERSLARSSDDRASSADRASIGSIDTHGDPSLALSSASAIGQINSPIVSGHFTPTSPVSSARNSPSASRPLSAVTSPSTDRLYPSVDALSRTSSSRSISSLGRTALGVNPNVTQSPTRPQSWVPPATNSEERQRAVDDEHIRKRLQEERDRVERLESEPASPFDDRTCPPSPDDQRRPLPGSRRMSALDISNADSSEEPSPTGQGPQLPAAMASSTSDFGSSASMSNPSMPSVLSQASSMDLPEPVLPGELTKGTTSDLLSSDDTVHPAEVRAFSQRDHYRGVRNGDEEGLERADENDDYDDSSDSDGGLVMSRRKSAAKPPESNDDASQSHSVSVSSKSSRRGSNSTTMKMSPRESADEQIPTDPESAQS